MQVKKIAGSSPIFKNIIFAFPSRPSRKCSRLRLWVVMTEEEKNKFQSETIEPTRPFYFRVFFTRKTKLKKQKKDARTTLYVNNHPSILAGRLKNGEEVGGAGEMRPSEATLKPRQQSDRRKRYGVSGIASESEFRGLESAAHVFCLCLLSFAFLFCQCVGSRPGSCINDLQNNLSSMARGQSFCCHCLSFPKAQFTGH